MPRKSAAPGPKPKCPDDYSLKGPQVEPGAGYWIRCPLPCPVSLDALRTITDNQHSQDHFPPYPTDDKMIAGELDELHELAALRDEPYRIEGSRPGRERLPLSLFLQLRPQPLGAAFNTARDHEPPVILTGRELARYFEGETPGLAHHHALNFLVRNVARPFCDFDVSPPRQARIWAALDIAIHGALTAAWHYKWLGTAKDGSFRPHVSRRPRPIECDSTLDVLYDQIPNSTFSGVAGPRSKPLPSPGTPRHPAYPSGHSTYSGAASELLSWFFPQYREELDRLADNIGMGRLWAGIHWRSDHVQGMKLGRTVARLVIDQLIKSGVPQFSVPPDAPPSRDELERQAQKFQKECGKAQPKPQPCP